MTTQEQFNRTLTAWFEADARFAAPPGALERAVELTRGRRPHPAWLANLGSDWVVGAPAVRRVPALSLRWSTTLLLLLLTLVLAGAAILIGTRLLQHTSPTAHLGLLAYGQLDADGDGAEDIMVAEWNGLNARLTASSARQSVPESCRGFGSEGTLWSPDGRHLAFRGSTGACDRTVFIADPDGHIVSSFPGDGWNVAWSPDSSRVVTWVEDGKIGIYGIDGRRQATLGPPARIAGGDSDPWWSADGEFIVVKGGYQLPIDGREVATTPLPDGVLSSDGTRLAYTAWLGRTRSLRVAGPDRSDPRVLFAIEVPPDYGDGGSVCETCEPGRIAEIIWSPANDRLVFEVAGRTMTEPGPSNGIYTVDLGSGAATLLVATGVNPAVSPIRFSPEGDRVLYRRYDDPLGERGQALRSIGIDGSDDRLLVSGTTWGDWQWVVDP